MDDHAHRRVIIAGGSISGLVLALCLQAADIDFLVLERGEIAPQLGASVGMYPHGNNVLQQLGVYDDMAALACPLIQGTSWDDHGNMFGDSQIYDIMTQRYESNTATMTSISILLFPLPPYPSRAPLSDD